MPRPARSQAVAPVYARRRHKTWMISMTLATLGWGCWWIAVFLKRVTDFDVSIAMTGWAADAFAVCGLLLAILTIRAKRSWLLFSLVALTANGALLFLPWMFEGVEL